MDTLIDEKIEVYKLVLSGGLKIFPNHFWSCKESDHYSPYITRYLIEDILNWNDKGIINNLRKQTFRDYKLSTMLSVKYNNSPYMAISKAYPDKDFKPWDFINTPNNYWKGSNGKDNASKAIKWLIEDKLKWSMDDVRDKINFQIFTEHNLAGMIIYAFDNDMFKAIDYTYPNTFKRWEIGSHVKNNYWTEEKGITATRWLIEDKLKWSDEDIRKYYSRQIFKDNNLYGMLQRCFNNNPYVALDKAYPGKFNELNSSNNDKVSNNQL